MNPESPVRNPIQLMHRSAKIGTRYETDNALQHALLESDMSSDTEGVGTGGHIPTKVYTTGDGRAVIAQSTNSVVILTADQILNVIAELHACYDYCAAWKESAPAKNGVRF